VPLSPRTARAPYKINVNMSCGVGRPAVLGLQGQLCKRATEKHGLQSPFEDWQ